MEAAWQDKAITAVVTGAAMGMGKAISRKLIADGVTVVGLDLNEASLEETRAELGDGVRAGRRRRR